MPVTRPLLFESVVGSVEMDLKGKGLARVERDGDLLLIPAGAMEFGLKVAAGTRSLPTFGGRSPIDPSRWTGAGGPRKLITPYVSEGTLVLTFVARTSNKIVWTGTVTDKRDSGNKRKSLERVDKAIAKVTQTVSAEEAVEVARRGVHGSPREMWDANCKSSRIWVRFLASQQLCKTR